MEFQYQVHHWDTNGVPFSTYVFVPEIHPITGKEFHEREDFAHILKVLCNSIHSLPLACPFESFNVSYFFYLRRTSNYEPPSHESNFEASVWNC